MLKKLLRSFGIGKPTIDSQAVSDALNARPVSDVQSEAETLLARSDLWDVVLRNPQRDMSPAELGRVNRTFFEKYSEVRARFMSLQFGYLGRPRWLPDTIEGDLRIVGHTVEQEFLFCRIDSDEVFEMATNGLEDRGGSQLNSIYHAILFYYSVYADKALAPKSKRVSPEH